GGGGDLIYPHHESEIAQTEGFTQKEPFARFWVHVAMVRYQGEKMSKSLGNLVLVRDVLRDHTADALRLYLLSNHYRESFEYADDGPARYEAMADLLRRAARTPGGNGPALDVTASHRAFMDSIADDLDTPTAVQVLREMAEQVVAGAEAGQDISDAREMFRQA